MELVYNRPFNNGNSIFVIYNLLKDVQYDNNKLIDWLEAHIFMYVYGFHFNLSL